MIELTQRPYVQELFAKPFSTFILVLTPVTFWPGRGRLDGLTREEAEGGARSDVPAGEASPHRLRRHGRGASSCGQNWEGDRMLRQGLAADAEPDEVRVRG